MTENTGKTIKNFISYELNALIGDVFAQYQRKEQYINTHEETIMELAKLLDYVNLINHCGISDYGGSPAIKLCEDFIKSVKGSNIGGKYERSEKKAKELFRPLFKIYCDHD